MVFVKINDTLYPARVDGRVSDQKWGGRASKAITLAMTYEEAAETFVDDVEWSIINQPESYEGESGEIVTPDSVEYDNSEYSVAGAITDHRNGTVTIEMGKPTEVETLRAQLENAVTEEELEAAYTEGVNSL